MKQSLLYVSYYFPPIKSIAVKRNYFLAKGLKEYFEDVQVLTTSNYKLLDQEVVPLDGLNIKHLPTFDYRTILAKFRKGQSTHFSESHKKNWFVSLLIKMNETIPFNLLFGEGGMLYIFNGYREGAKYLSDKDDKYIITSYRPFANVFIGYLLKKKFRNAVWITNFHDFPIDGIRNNVLFPYFQKWIWKKMLQDTSHNITVSHGVENHIRDFTSNVSTIMNGVNIRKSINKLNKKFKLVYTGSLYENLSKPKLLLKSTAHLIHSSLIMEDDIEIIYAGKDSKLWMSMIKEFGLESIATDLGEVTSKEAMGIQDTANINILLTWASKDQSGVITGKFYEYLGSNNPILVIINGIMDKEISKLFQDLNCGKVVATIEPNSENEVKEFLYDHYMFWKNNIEIPSYELNLNNYSWENQVKKLVGIILAD